MSAVTIKVRLSQNESFDDMSVLERCWRMLTNKETDSDSETQVPVSRKSNLRVMPVPDESGNWFVCRRTRGQIPDGWEMVTRPETKNVVTHPLDEVHSEFSSRVSTRVTAEEHALITERAFAERMSVSVLIHKTLREAGLFASTTHNTTHNTTGVETSC